MSAGADYWKDVAQDLAEALFDVLDNSGGGNLAYTEAVTHARGVLGRLPYDHAGSASSQNYIDTGVRLLAEPADPEVVVMVVDAGDEEELVVPWEWVHPHLGTTHKETDYWRTGDVVLACPWAGCSSTTIYEVDRAERWNPVVTDDVNVNDPDAVQPDRLTRADRYENGRAIYVDAGPNPLAGLPILAVHEGRDGDGYATSHHLCDGCQRRVSLPDWLETVWS